MLDKTKFLAPPAVLRPLRIVHDFGYRQDMSLKQKQEAVKNRLSRLKALGYGGVVTNVPFEHYLESEDEWGIFEYAIRTAVDLGLRLWIYDEKGYPSGTAGGLTLKGHPEYEAQGLVELFETAVAGEEVVIKHPKGHGRVLSACAYKGTSKDDMEIASRKDLGAYLDAAQNLHWKPDEGRWVVCCYIIKPLYEGTHAQHNVCESRRYINVINKEAVRSFIENTYAAYYKRVGQYFGKEIEAFFTDEPSLMAAYINEGLQPKIHDQPMEDMPLLPVVSWSEDVLPEFKKRCGYGLVPWLPYLFGGNSEKACKVRLDFHKTLSELYSKNFFEQIGDFCANHNIAFSGHILLEEELKHHAVFEGDFFSHLKHMHYPGIDMLTSVPEKVKMQAATPKLISSIAHFYNRKHVMSEVSAHAEVSAGQKVGLREMLCAIAIQSALGVDVFTSYYGDENMTDQENETFTTFAGRVWSLLDGGRNTAQVALYYPIESVWAYTVPISGQLFGSKCPNEVQECDESWLSTVQQLLDSQIDFEMLGDEELQKCILGNRSLKAPGGEAYRVLVIPDIKVLEPDMLARLEDISRSGIPVIYMGKSRPVLLAEGCRGDLVERLELWLEQSNVIKLGSPDLLADEIDRVIQRDIRLDRKLPQMLYAHKAFDTHHTYILVNTGDEMVDFEVRLDAAGKASLWNPVSGGVTELGLMSPGRGESGVSLSMEGYQTLLITVEN